MNWEKWVLLCEWHCTTDHTTWPGCGKCGECRKLAPQVFDAARQLLAELERVEALLLTTVHDADA